MLKAHIDEGARSAVMAHAPIGAATTRLAVSVREAVAMSGLSRSFLYEAMGRGELPFIKKGRRRLIPTSSLSAYVLGSGA
jgi:excisionase family DNA binding protein